MSFKADLSKHYKQTAVEYWWSEIRLTTGYTDLPKIDLKEAPLISILTELGHSLSFLDHVRVVKSVKEHSVDFEVDEYFQAVGFNHSSYLLKALEVLPSLPKSFINWATKKALSPKDFRVFFGFELSALEGFIEKTVALNPSKSEGLLIFEYAFDLFFKELLTDEFYNFKTSEALLKSLKKKRFYKAISSDEEIQNQISKIDFGTDSKIKTLRQGDTRLLHIEIKSSHPQKLKTSLERISKNLEKIEDAWI